MKVWTVEHPDDGCVAIYSNEAAARRHAEQTNVGLEDHHDQYTWCEVNVEDECPDILWVYVCSRGPKIWRDMGIRDEPIKARPLYTTTEPLPAEIDYMDRHPDWVIVRGTDPAEVESRYKEELSKQ